MAIFSRISRFFAQLKRKIYRRLPVLRRFDFILSFRNIIMLAGSVIVIGTGLFFVWASTLSLPNVESFEERRVGVSTKIYDREGKTVLYDLNQNTRRTVVTSDEISPFVKKATVAIEDDQFYEHGGVRLSSTIRAILVDILIKLHLRGGYTQGGSTITQQVIKNALLTTEKRLSRKLKEWVLATNLEKIMTKDQILTIYLNENPYGGNIYGIEEASQAFFGKKASDVTLAEAATLAALPQRPSYYSPYGNHKEELATRKNLVLQKMLEHDFITEAEYEQAKTETVVFQKQENISIKAPHFVMYVKEYLEDKYGADELATRGLKVITTLDYELQQKAEEVVKESALKNEKNFNAENAALTAIDPKTGQILVMVGSRDYFDKKIDGNFNVTTAHRQPGSSFKPFVYAEAFNKGFLPETIVFDLQTEFSTSCNPDGTPILPDADCYMPVNYDGLYAGPISLRSALAESRNIPAIKVLYLAGLKDSLNLAKDMGITSLGSANDYGLTLVLGGGEVSPLEMTSAYSVFADEGIKNPIASILKITDREGNTIEEFTPQPTRVLPENTAMMINDVLSDDNARIPAYGVHSALYIPGHDVAVKTGTTNDYKDTWIVGYSPNLTVGAWAGNNDNRPMEKKVAGFIVAPMWNAFMKVALEKTDVNKEVFRAPELPDTTDMKPILRGEWQNPEGVHDTLYYVDKNDPLGPAPVDPYKDPQFPMWEYAVQKWLAEQSGNTSSLYFQYFGTSTPLYSTTTGERLR